MKLFTQRAWLLIAIAGLTELLSACSPSSEATTSPSTTTTKSSEPVELVFYGGDAEDTINNLYIVPFNKKYADIRLKYVRGTEAAGTTLPQMIATGQQLDVYYGSSGDFESKIEAYRLGYDLTDLLRTHKYDTSHLEPTAIEALKRDSGGKLYGLPSNMLSYLLYYNKAIFDKFGVAYPKDGMTWSETFDLAQKVTRTDGDKRYYGIGHASTTALIDRNQFSLPVADVKTNKPTINSDERWKTVFNTMFLNPLMTQSFAETGKIPNWASFSKDQNLAMITYSSTVPLALQADITPLDWDMVSIPVFPELPKKGTQATPVYFGVASISKHKEEAARVVEYFSSIEFMVRNSKTGVLMASQSPEVTKVLGAESPFPNKNWAAITYHPFASLSPKAVYSAKVLSVYGTHLNNVIAGKMDLNTGFRTMEELAQKEINELLVK